MNWLRNFMMGRYGNDQLNVGLLVFSLLLILLGRILGFSPLIWVALIILVLSYVRMFSKNTAARYQENQVFLRYWLPVRSKLYRVRVWFSGAFSRRKDKTHRYYKCPKCKQRVRVPKGKGKIKITCPSCKETFIKKT